MLPGRHGPVPTGHASMAGRQHQHGTIAAMCNPRRPALRYHGGKWMLAPWIISHFPEHRFYVEPFGGGASVLLRKPRASHEVYNDLDGEIVSFFRVLRDHGDELRRLVYLTPFSRDEYGLSMEPSEDPLEQARRTLIRSFQGHGSSSLGRVSGFRSKSQQNNTGAAIDWMHLPSAMEAMTERLRGVVIENRPAGEVIRQHDGPETLFYLDPPYLPSTRKSIADRAHSKSYRHELSVREHEDLLGTLAGLRGAAVVSGYPSAVYDAGLAGWYRVEREACTGSTRPGKATEVLWINRPPAEASCMALFL
jgi:DNA adenine methylase